MKKEKEQIEYYRLTRADHNMFCVEIITVEGSKVINIEKTEATFLPIAFDKLRRKTGEAFFKAVQENL